MASGTTKEESSTQFAPERDDIVCIHSGHGNSTSRLAKLASRWSLPLVRKLIPSSKRCDGGSSRRSEAELYPGILIAWFDHLGDGEFKADLVKSRIPSRSQVRVLRVVLWTAFAVIAGASVGTTLDYVTSAQYILQITTGLTTALLTLAGQPLLAKLTEPRAWRLGAGTGTLSNVAVMQVIKGNKGAMPPGRYRLEVQATGEWSFCFRQPKPGERFPFGPKDAMGESEPTVYGPLVFGSRPTIDRVQNSAGLFQAEAFSVDGKHRSTVYRRSGSFWQGGIETELNPGIEYMIFVQARGSWLLAFDYEE